MTDHSKDKGSADPFSEIKQLIHALYVQASWIKDHGMVPRPDIADLMLDAANRLEAIANAQATSPRPAERISEKELRLIGRKVFSEAVADKDYYGGSVDGLSYYSDGVNDAVGAIVRYLNQGAPQTPPLKQAEESVKNLIQELAERLEEAVGYYEVEDGFEDPHPTFDICRDLRALATFAQSPSPAQEEKPPGQEARGAEAPDVAMKERTVTEGMASDVDFYLGQWDCLCSPEVEVDPEEHVCLRCQVTGAWGAMKRHLGVSLTAVSETTKESK